MPVDPRFYAPLGALTLSRIADETGSALLGEGSVEASNIGASDTAKAGELCFFEGKANNMQVSSKAAACFCIQDHAEKLPDGVAALVTAFPRRAHAAAASLLFKARDGDWGDEAIDVSASIDSTAIIGPGAVIGPDAAIGEHTIIGPNAVVGPGVQIGQNCTIGANVSIYCALIGNNVHVLSGARIGEAGFGVMAGPDGAEDAPQFGRVILQDHVTVGANSCIDRGAFDDTIIGERTKIDNLCQIAHNVVLGRSVVMAAFGGISGTVTVGDGSMLGGRVGVADHVNVGEGASLAASSGLFRDVPDGETWGGTPAKPIRQWMREISWLQKQANPKKPKA